MLKLGSEIAEATVTSKGQITVPSEIRKLLHLAAGDRLRFFQSKNGSVVIEARKRRSILDIARENPLKAPKPLGDLDAEINAAVGEAMAERERRARAKS
ncbi:MAG TPA: type II toxin-antitoxin system PrlF family antitoxin [Roseiarcus sp.]|nr:type II toxin-antitoxin system PrlF family antitoxin [Roseiarcus sp.]